MKKIKIVSISLFITIFGLTVNAQNKADRPEGFSKKDGGRGKMDPTEQVDREMERLDKQLTLNDKQKEEVRKILKENEENRKSETGTSNKSDKKEKGKMDSNRKEMDEKIEKILTSEQKTKYSEFKNQKPEYERNDSKGRNKDTSEDRKNRKRENSRES